MAIASLASGASPQAVRASSLAFYAPLGGNGSIESDQTGHRDLTVTGTSTVASRPPTTGWFPLAPREVYVPSYAVSRTYVERVNINHVTNVTQINNFYRGRDDDRDHANYRYRAMASAVVPAPGGRGPAETGRGSFPQPADGRGKRAT